MTTTKTPTTSVSLAVRGCVAVGIVVLLSSAWTAAGKSSHHAVQEARATFSRTYVTLPRVEVVAKREGAATPVAKAASKRLPQG
jgi:hypothetical protein